MISQIQIHQQFAQIGLRTDQAQWRISSPSAELNLRQEQPWVEIQQIPGTLEVDQREAFAQEGLMSIFDLTRSEAARARQINFDAIAETARWGDRFAHIERSGNPIADWTWRDVTGPSDWIPALVPQPFSVHIRYEPGRAEIQVQPGRVALDPAVHPPEVSFSPGAVQVYTRQYASVTVTPPLLPGLLVDGRG
ncbi:hypothetical protein CVV65_14705 [Kyrpidia spormannii]|uniref:Uncharacterized protein n=1 Tax=Kyrpidia spormannii TaxID=2055160 RepID=A0A2K8N9P9_9BACL|nr:DUF6470 family protein [Kyrpidia spormannii]ATY86023.1 hypothetical protein CVV65_14705 [Kyrpidia spormannii]